MKVKIKVFIFFYSFGIIEDGLVLGPVSSRKLRKELHRHLISSLPINY